MWLLSCSKNQHNVLYFTSVLDLAYCVYSYCVVTLMRRELPHTACLWTVTRDLILSGRMVQECNVLKVPLSEMEWEVIFGILKAVWKYISMFTPFGRLENGWEISICPFQSALFFQVIFWLVIFHLYDLRTIRMPLKFFLFYLWSQCTDAVVLFQLWFLWISCWECNLEPLKTKFEFLYWMSAPA